MTEAPWLSLLDRRVSRWVASSLGPGWVVAVSGGSDSVGLLRALHAVAPRSGLILSVAHLNHGARGLAAREDAAFVEDLARSLGLPFDLGHWAATRPGHFEADARRARYIWLAEVARARGAKVVAVGHTRDDQAETVLHRIIRGTGVRGLAGIPAKRSIGDGLTLVRPLLDVSRQDIRAFLDGFGQVYRDDASNADTRRTRARIRHDLLPRLAADYNPQIVEALVRLARLAAGSERAVREPIRNLERLARRPASHREEVAFDRVVLAGCPEFLRAEVIRRGWRRQGWPESGMSADRWRRLAGFARGPGEGRFDAGAGIEAIVDSSRLILRRSKASVAAAPSLEPRPLEVPGSISWPGGRVVVTLDPEAPRDETIDLDRLVLPLSVRAPKAGDRFNPLGLGDHQRPLNDVFRSRGVARDARATTPLLCDQTGIVWVVGHQIAHRVRLTEATTRRAGLRWDADPEG